MKNKPIQHQLLNDLSELIEQAKQQAVMQVNSAMTMVYWQIGKRINEDVLKNERAEYGRKVIPSIAEELTTCYGRSFVVRNLRRMMQFAEKFPDLDIVSTLSTQLSWSHFLELILIKQQDARLFYAHKIVNERWSVRHTRKQIAQKAYERSEIANSQLSTEILELKHTFKDPYIRRMEIVSNTEIIT